MLLKIYLLQNNKNCLKALHRVEYLEKIPIFTGRKKLRGGKSNERGGKKRG